MVAWTQPATVAEIGQPADASLFVSDNADRSSPVPRDERGNAGAGEEHATGERTAYSFSDVWSGQVVATSNNGAAMADKSPGRILRKPELSIKERRASKRAKAVDSTTLARNCKG